MKRNVFLLFCIFIDFFLVSTAVAASNLCPTDTSLAAAQQIAQKVAEQAYAWYDPVSATAPIANNTITLTTSSVTSCGTDPDEGVDIYGPVTFTATCSNGIWQGNDAGQEALYGITCS